ncbi:MAG: hypothetical protein ABEJ06_02575 [Haloarculaceae archaeon]
MALPALQVAAPGGIEVLIVLFVLSLSVLLPLVVSVLVYRDARARDSRHALAWSVASFFGNLVVWLLYLVVRDEVGPGAA